ncbi:MAG TPA: TadE/TadG family type IV pilus assembly protein [Propionicimonas sp.]
MEFAMIVPVLVLLVGLVVGGARTWLARGVVEQAAGAAVRGMSQARGQGEAVRTAQELAIAQAAAGGVRCERLFIDVDASGFTTAPGTHATVTARVHCDVPLSDVLVPGWPGVIGVEASAETVLDTYRGRK